MSSSKYIQTHTSKLTIVPHANHVTTILRSCQKRAEGRTWRCLNKEKRTTKGQHSTPDSTPRRQTNSNRAYGNGNAQERCRRQHHHRNVFSKNYHKRERMYICPKSSQQSAHIQFQPLNHIQLKEGIRKQQATRRREESIPLHTSRLQKRNEAIRTTRTTHETIRWISALREKDNISPKVPDKFTTKANDMTDDG